MNFLNELMESTAEVETPRSFWWWAGLATISAVVKDNIWLPRGEEEGTDNCLYKLYPNIYVMLHADSGLKKGPPVNLAKRLVKKVNNTRIITGRSSIQGMLKELGTAYTAPGGIVVNKSVAFIAASEFSSSLVEDKAAMTILTDLYDRNYNEGDWKSLLKMEQFTLKDPTVTLLVATNEAHFDDFIQKKDVHGGFIGRMFVINEKEPANLNSLIKKLKRVPDEEKLAAYLKEVSALKGPFKSLDNTAAGDYYDSWYNQFHKDIRDSGYKDDTGTLQRYGDSVLKVAMCMALAKEPKLEIDEDTMIEAITRSEKFIGSVREATIGKNARKEDDKVGMQLLFMKELIKRENHMVSREQFLKKYWVQGINARNLDEIVESMFQAGHIKVENIAGKVIYRMPDEVAKEFYQHFAGRNKL